MSRSFDDTLNLISSYLPGSLASPDEFEKLKQIATKFPLLLSPGAAFESRLAEGEPSLDMFFCIEKENRSIPAGENPQHELDPSLYQHPVWKAIRRFFSSWCDIKSPIESKVDRVFFEFDVGSQVPDIPIPSFFIHISKDNPTGSTENSENESKYSLPNNYQWVFDAISIIKGESVSAETLKNAIFCFEKLLPGTIVDHIGIMSSRTADILRINVTNMSENQVYEYISRIGLDIRLQQLKKILPPCSQFVSYMVLAFDISDEIHPKIGVELRMPRDELNLTTQHRWHPFLDFLVDQGMCSLKKKQGLVEWSGRSRDIFDQDFYKYMIYRYINLIKLVFEPDKDPMAKGYFSFMIQSVS